MPKQMFHLHGYVYRTMSPVLTLFFILIYLKLSQCRECLIDCHGTSLGIFTQHCIELGGDRKLLEFCKFQMLRRRGSQATFLISSVLTLKKWPMTESSCAKMCHQKKKCSLRSTICFMGLKAKEETTTNRRVTVVVKKDKVASSQKHLCPKLGSAKAGESKSERPKKCKNCKGENKRCEGDRCVCQLGYSSVQGTNRCVKGCTLYSEGFVLQSKGKCINKYYTLILGISIAECRRRCVKSEFRLCAAYQVSMGKCYLLKPSQASSTSKPWDDLGTCNHWQRKCRGCSSTCRPPKYACENRHCVCNHGYTPLADGTCVKNCSRFSEVFSLQMQHKCYTSQPQGKTYTVETVKECMTICLSRAFCTSIEVNCNQCIVQIQSSDWFNKGVWEVNKNCQHYNRLCFKRGPKCTRTCIGPNYICKGDKCVCNTGYSKTLDGMCVKQCKEYSDSYSLQQEERCVANYHEERPWKSNEACITGCNKANFECISTERLDHTCYLEKYRAIMVLHDSFGCGRYSRSCLDSGRECDACDGPNYRCRGGKCQCSRGFSKVPKYKRCVHQCFSYTSTFTKQSTTHCIHKYEKKIPHTNARTCKKYCLQQKKFLCGAFHIYNGNCYLMEWTHERAEEKWEKHTKCTHFSRDCNPVCEMGLMRVIGSNECVQRCWKYADTFQLVSSTWCLTVNLETFKHADKDRCKQQCIDYKKKLCEGFELTKHHCYLLSTNIHKVMKWKQYDFCHHYQRLCIEGGF